MKLTRQQKRQYTRKPLTEKELFTLVEDATQYGVEYSVNAFAAVIAVVLRDKIELSKPKTIKALKEISEYFESVNQGYVKIEEIKEAMQKELKIEFK